MYAQWMEIFRRLQGYIFIITPISVDISGNFDEMLDRKR